MGIPDGETNRDAVSADDWLRLIAAVQELSAIHDLDALTRCVRRAARDLSNADGVTFVLRDGDHCYYVDEDAIAPLWKGKRFPARTCISGWSMQHRQAVVIRDIYEDPRVPHDAYRPTFVKSLAMIPVRVEDPVAAIGAYWATHHTATQRELSLLQALANSTAVCLANVELFQAKQDAIRHRDEMLAIASHELRTPLTVLRLQMQQLQRLDAESTRPDLLEPKLTRASRQVERLVLLVEQLIDFSRLAANGLVLERTPCDMVEMASNIVARLRPLAERAGCELQLRTQPNTLRGTWDCERVEQVLDHLVVNAIKYGAGKPVQIELANDNDHAVVRVADHGIGIGAEHHDRIFAAFGRAVPLTSYGGLGLGLYLASTIIAAHGGNLTVHSTPGQGATFIFTLPCNASATAGDTR